MKQKVIVELIYLLFDDAGTTFNEGDGDFYFSNDAILFHLGLSGL